MCMEMHVRSITFLYFYYSNDFQVTFLFPTIPYAIWYDSYFQVKDQTQPSILSFAYTRSVKNIFIRGHLGSFDAKLAPYGGIWVFMTFGIGIVFVIPIDIFDRLDFFDCQKSDYKKIIIELNRKWSIWPRDTVRTAPICESSIRHKDLTDRLS